MNKSPVGHTQNAACFSQVYPEDDLKALEYTSQLMVNMNPQGRELKGCHVQPKAAWTHSYGLCWCHKCIGMDKQGIGGRRKSEKEIIQNIK